MDLDYHFEHKDGSGVEEGSMEVKREKKGGMWKTEIETEAHPFSGTPIIPRRINHMSFELESDRATKLRASTRTPTWAVTSPGTSSASPARASSSPLRLLHASLRLSSTWADPSRSR